MYWGFRNNCPHKICLPEFPTELHINQNTLLSRTGYLPCIPFNWWSLRRKEYPDLNDHFNLRILYVEFRRYLLRLNLNMLTRNLADVGTQFTRRAISQYIIFNPTVPKLVEDSFPEIQIISEPLVYVYYQFHLDNIFHDLICYTKIGGNKNSPILST